MGGTVPVAERSILALGGHEFSRRRGNEAIRDHLLGLVPRERPRVCLLPTASGDPADQIAAFRSSVGERVCELSHVSLFRLETEACDVAEHLLAQDLIYVGGGSMLNLIAIWRAHGIDELLRRCWERGVILAGPERRGDVLVRVGREPLGRDRPARPRARADRRAPERALPPRPGTAAGDPGRGRAPPAPGLRDRRRRRASLPRRSSPTAAVTAREEAGGVEGRARRPRARPRGAHASRRRWRPRGWRSTRSRRRCRSCARSGRCAPAGCDEVPRRAAGSAARPGLAADLVVHIPSQMSCGADAERPR